MKLSRGRLAGSGARIAALLLFVLTLVPATHVHADRLDGPSACASCALAQTPSTVAPVAALRTTFVVLPWLAAPPVAVVRLRASRRPVGRAPPSHGTSSPV